MPRRPAIDRARAASHVLGYMGRDPLLLELADNLPPIIVLIGARRRPMPARNDCSHRQGRLTFGGTRGLGRTRVHSQAVVILPESFSASC
jgi:hypothetical protein